MSDQQLDCALDLMRRLPPQYCEKNLAELIDLVPSLCDELLSAVDQPLKIAKDKETGKEYIICDYNRDGDSYRSPWTNSYDPPLEDGQLPSERMRTLEIEANAAFEAYRDMYFDGGVSSAYFWELDGYGFAGIVLLKKNGDGTKNVKGCWDSIHVLEVADKTRAGAHYKLTSTVMLWLQTSKTGSGVMNLGGSMTRQCEQDCAVTDATPHLVNIGRMIEEQESKMRMTLNEIYFGKTKKVVSDLRSLEKASETRNRDELAKEIRTAVASRGAGSRAAE